MVRDAYKLALPVLTLGIVLLFLDIWYGAVFFLLIGGFICYFFRNPYRVIPDAPNLIVSPADGKVVKIADGPEGERTISIFLSIFDVHVNRSPVSGELKSLEYKRGRFKAAFDEEASRVNEQNILTIQGDGIRVTVRQIAGLIARRVICWKKPGDILKRGELIGLIRFGSRVDIVIPERTKLMVKVGERVRGGSSIIGEYL
ncbi:MAG: phosphatidylserine decarboxylase family protein [Acidobacteria bacterium]|nr:phosphatidylserine decarboxylase family protein [Acidobacteriota bacterium]